jgi:hypothetical protein
LISISKKAKPLVLPMIECHLGDLSSVPTVIAEIQNLRAQIEDATKSMPVLDMQNEFLPPFASATFIVENLRDAINLARNELNPNCFYTPTQEIYGCLWRLKIYPFGNMSGRSTHVSIFVEMNKGTGVKSPYSYRIEIKALNPREKPIVREFRSEFTVNDSWGWNKAILIDKVMGNGFMSDEGHLTIVLSLRTETYYQAYQDLRAALAEEKAKYHILKLQRISE